MPYLVGTPAWYAWIEYHYNRFIRAYLRSPLLKSSLCTISVSVQRLYQSSLRIGPVSVLVQSLASLLVTFSIPVQSSYSNSWWRVMFLWLLTCFRACASGSDINYALSRFDLIFTRKTSWQKSYISLVGLIIHSSPQPQPDLRLCRVLESFLGVAMEYHHHAAAAAGVFLARQKSSFGEGAEKSTKWNASGLKVSSPACHKKETHRRVSEKKSSLYTNFTRFSAKKINW